MSIWTIGEVLAFCFLIKRAITGPQLLFARLSITLLALSATSACAFHSTNEAQWMLVGRLLYWAACLVLFGMAIAAMPYELNEFRTELKDFVKRFRNKG